jgi:hypothetical protein
MNPFVVLPHLLAIPRERQPEWMSQHKDPQALSTAVLLACIVDPDGWDWRNSDAVRYAAAYLCLRHASVVRVPIDDVRRFITAMGLAWDSNVFEDEDYDPESAFSWSSGCLASHPLWDVSNGGRKSLTIVEADEAWPRDVVYEGRPAFEPWMHEEFCRLQNPIIKETKRDRITNTLQTTLALRDRLDDLTIQPLAFG